MKLIHPAWILVPLLSAAAIAIPSLGTPTQRVAEPKSLVHVRPNIAPMGLAAYASTASDVVVGTVLGKTIVKDSGRTAFTRYTIDTTIRLKECAPSRVQVDVGGSDDPSALVLVDGAPRFSVGDEVLLFLHRASPDAPFGILGLGQGTYKLSTGVEGQLLVSGLHAQGDQLPEFLSEVVTAWAGAQQGR